MRSFVSLSRICDEEPSPINVESDEKNRFRKILSLPERWTAGNPSRHPAEVVRIDEIEAKRSTDSGERILLVSADHDLRLLLRSFLEHSGFQVACFAEISRAVDTWRPDHEPAVLVLDLQPLNALLMQQAIDLTEHHANLPVVALFGPDAIPELLKSVRNRGWKALTKPFFVPSLLGVVWSAFDSTHHMAPANVTPRKTARREEVLPCVPNSSTRPA